MPTCVCYTFNYYFSVTPLPVASSALLPHATPLFVFCFVSHSDAAACCHAVAVLYSPVHSCPRSGFLRETVPPRDIVYLLSLLRSSTTGASVPSSSSLQSYRHFHELVPSYPHVPHATFMMERLFVGLGRGPQHHGICSNRVPTDS